MYPSSTWAWSARGTVLVRMGRTVEAEAAFRRQLEIEPTHERARNGLVELLLETGRPRDALAVLGPFRKKAPRDAGVALRYGQALLAAGDQRAGLETLEGAVKLAPGTWSQNTAAYYLAVSNVQLPRASTWAESSVSGHAEELRRRSAQGPGAREASEVSSLVAAWDTLGWVRFRQGRLEEAERYVSTAVRLGRSGEELEHLGEILERKALRTEAVAAYAQAVAANGDLRARRRLETLVAASEVDPLVDAARVELLRRRILHREPAPGGAAVDARVLLVLGADGTVSDVLPVDEEVLPDAAALRGTRHGLEVLDRSLGRLVVHGRYRCAGGACAWLLGSEPVPNGPLPE